jgi:hypothetical protein
VSASRAGSGRSGVGFLTAPKIASAGSGCALVRYERARSAFASRTTVMGVGLGSVAGVVTARRDRLRSARSSALR